MTEAILGVLVFAFVIAGVIFVLIDLKRWLFPDGFL